MHDYFTIWINGEWCGESYSSLEEAKSSLGEFLYDLNCDRVGDSVSVVIAKCQDMCTGTVSLKLDEEWDYEYS